MHIWRYCRRRPVQWHMEISELANGCVDLRWMDRHSAYHCLDLWKSDGHYSQRTSIRTFDSLLREALIRSPVHNGNRRVIHYHTISYWRITCLVPVTNANGVRSWRATVPHTVESGKQSQLGNYFFQVTFNHEPFSLLFLLFFSLAVKKVILLPHHSGCSLCSSRCNIPP
jgi:hypothetical protein